MTVFGGFSLFFHQRYCFKSWGFLRLQTPTYDNFHFLGYNGFLQFFRPLVLGVKRKILFFSSIFSSYGLRHINPPRA